jgi:hypothetical protein
MTQEHGEYELNGHRLRQGDSGLWWVLPPGQRLYWWGPYQTEIAARRATEATP